MERKDATRLTYDEIQMFGMPALFTDWRVIRDTVPKGMTLYELRHEDENWGKPCQVAKRTCVFSDLPTAGMASPIRKIRKAWWMHCSL